MKHKKRINRHFSVSLISVIALLGCSDTAIDSDPSTKLMPIEDTVVVVYRSTYAEKMQGFWLGQSIANWTGLVTEMDKVGTPETMPFYTDADWGTKDLPAMWGEYVPHTDTIDFFLVEEGEPWGADDDTDIEYMYHHLHDQHQTSKLTAEQIRDGWLTHTYSQEDAPLYQKFPDSEPQAENFLWEANQIARDLMEQGMLPPDTGDPSNNPKYMMIDAQLTTEIFGLFAPARPDVALDIAYLPIRVAASKESAAIAEFYVVMHSLASYVDSNLPMQEQTFWLAEQARKGLPDESFPAKMYDFIRNDYLQNRDKDTWESTRDKVYQRYQVEQNDGYIYSDPFQAGINFAASLVSWFYGEGDFKRTIQIGTLTGWDADNPTATWGGLLGFMIGANGIKQAFPEHRLSDTYWIHRTRRNFPDRTPGIEGEDTFTNMAQQDVRIVDRIVVERMGGDVDKEGNRWLIPAWGGRF